MLRNRRSKKNLRGAFINETPLNREGAERGIAFAALSGAVSSGFADFSLNLFAMSYAFNFFVTGNLLAWQQDCYGGSLAGSACYLKRAII
jgi:hypothetical protein